jgi:hypothetical protein
VTYIRVQEPTYIKCEYPAPTTKIITEIAVLISLRKLANDKVNGYDTYDRKSQGYILITY